MVRTQLLVKTLKDDLQYMEREEQARAAVEAAQTPRQARRARKRLNRVLGAREWPIGSVPLDLC